MRKIAFITGATAGFGKASAYIFAANGYDLIINGRRLEKLQTLADEIEGPVTPGIPDDLEYMWVPGAKVRVKLSKILFPFEVLPPSLTRIVTASMTTI